VTILAQDDLGGLEVRNSEGDWIGATPIPGTFVVNLGDLFPIWTNGAYRSSWHRVMNGNGGENRHSVVFFYSPGYYTRVACVPSCLPESGEVDFQAVVAGEHSRYRLAESRKHLR
jgi:isopenicillin N synthase-like dioxygenase